MKNKDLYYISINGKVATYHNKKLLTLQDAQAIAVKLSYFLHKEALDAVKKNDNKKYLDCILSSSNIFILPYYLH